MAGPWQKYQAQPAPTTTAAPWLKYQGQTAVEPAEQPRASSGVLGSFGGLTPEEGRAAKQEKVQAAQDRLATVQGRVEALPEDAAPWRRFVTENSVTNAQGALQDAQDAPEPTQTRLRNAIDSFARSALQIAPSVTRSAGVVGGMATGDDENAIVRFSEAMEAQLEEMFPGDPGRQEEFVATHLAGGAGSMTSFLMGGLAAKAAGIPTWAATGMMGAAMQGAEGHQDAAESGAAYEQRMASFALNAGLGVTEAIPLERFFNRLDRATSGRVKSIIANSAAQSMEEAIQEIVQEVGHDIIAREIYDTEREMDLPGALRAGAVGAILGAGMGGAAGMASPRARDEEPPQQATPDQLPALEAPAIRLPDQSQPTPDQIGQQAVEQALFGVPDAEFGGAPPAEPAAREAPSPLPAAGPTPEEIAILRGARWSDEDIRDMSAAERQAEVEQALEQGVQPVEGGPLEPQLPDFEFDLSDVQRQPEPAPQQALPDFEFDLSDVPRPMPQTRGQAEGELSGPSGMAEGVQVRSPEPVAQPEPAPAAVAPSPTPSRVVEQTEPARGLPTVEQAREHVDAINQEQPVAPPGSALEPQDSAVPLPEPQPAPAIPQQSQSVGPVGDSRAAEAQEIVRNAVERIAGKGVAINFADKITMDDPKALAASGHDASGAEVAGYYDRTKRLVAVSLADGYDHLNTALHESWHAVEDLLTPKERAALKREAPRLKEIAATSLNIPADKLKLSDDEVFATAFAAHSQGNLKGAHVGVRRAFEKIGKALRSIRNALHGAGFRTYEDVFDAVDRGEKAQEKQGGSALSTQRKADPSRTFHAPTDRGEAARAYLARHVHRRLARLPTATRLRSLLQDRFVHVRQFQDAIQEAGRPVPETDDAYLAESLYYGRAGERLFKLRKEVIEPLVDRMRALKISREEMDLFLMAKHAPERNAAIRKINPAIADPSGMSDADAADIIETVRRAGREDAFEEVAKMVYAMNRQDLERRLKAGLITQEAFDHLRSRWSYYVPLRGFEMDPDAEDIRGRIGRAYDVRGAEYQQALGRQSRADSPLAYSILQAEEGIVRAERNRVAKTILRLVENNPNKEVWEILKAETRRRINPETGMVETYTVPAASLRNKVDVLSAKVGGKEHYLLVHDERLRRALQMFDAHEMHPVVRAIGSVTRLLARLSTSWNPQFIVTNFARDIQTALIHLTEERQAHLRRNVATSIPKAMAGVYGYLNGKQETEWQRYAHEFAEAGGKISFFNYSSIDEQRRAIETALDRGRFGQLGRSFGDLIENMNGAVENAVRLATYVHLKKAGVSKAKAASVARELTVNFNRRGEWGGWINNLFMFANAGVQGTTRMGQALVRSRKVQKIALGLIAVGFALDWLNYMVAGDDEEDETNRYSKLPDWVKERNMVIMLPKHDKPYLPDYLKIPLPYGWNVPQVIGRNIASVARGDTEASDALSDIIGAMAGSFMPIDMGGSFAQWISPTVTDPIVQISENQDWKGSPIAPERFRGDHRPEAQRHWNSVSAPAKAIAETANQLSGGNDHRSGWADVSPEYLDHVFEFFTGGAGAFVNHILTTGASVAKGELPPLERVPFIRSVAGTIPDYASTSRYYVIRDAMQIYAAERKGHEEDGATEELKRMERDYPIESRVFQEYQRTEALLRRLTRARNKEAEAGRDTAVQAIEKQISEARANLRRAWEQARRATRSQSESPRQPAGTSLQ